MRNLLSRSARCSLLPSMAAALGAVVLCATVHAQEEMIEDANPQAATAPKTAFVQHPTPEQLEAGFAGWAKRYSNTFQYESCGPSMEKRPILVGKITDASVPDADKQIALLTSAHGAKELSATTGLLRFMKWLLSEDPAAVEIRRRQIVLVVPYTDPDHVALGKGTQSRLIYSGRTSGGKQLWTIDGVSEPHKYPEAAALQTVIDRYKPDLFIDYHGFNQAGRTMWDSTGVSWGTPVSRPFIRDVIRVINESAEKEGFQITNGEEDDGKILTTSPVPGYPDYLFYLRSALTNLTTYSYARYHTLGFIIESGSEESTIARTRAALQMGHRRWRFDRYESYPVNQVGIWTSVAVTAYGTNATERRNSRVELWQKQPQMDYAGASPTPAKDTVMAYVSTTDEGRKKIRAKKITTVIDSVKNNPQFDVEGLKTAAARFPFTHFGGQRPNYKPNEGLKPGDGGPLKHGLAIRLFVPYGDAAVRNVRLDGHLISESDADGYRILQGPGTVVEIAIPPAKVKEFHIVSCEYDTKIVRRDGFTQNDW